MHLIYYSHSYRPADKDINEFFQELMLREGMTPSLDPPSKELNSAKPERHLRSTDGMIAVLPYRDPQPSKYMLYEIALCVRAHKPVLVFVEDVLPNYLISSALLQRRFSRRHLLREMRSHRHALRILKTYIGTEPPPSYQPSSGQRSCLVIGASSLSDKKCSKMQNHLTSLKYNPIFASSGNDCLSYDQPHEDMITQSILCVSFTEKLSPLEFYLLGAVRASLMPSILLTRDPDYTYHSSVPKEYQPRKVTVKDMDVLCRTLEKEISIFEQDYLELEEQDEVIRYRTALMREGNENGVYSHKTRDVIFNLVAGNIGEIDMSKDKIEVSKVVGPVNIKSQLDRVTQIVKNAPGMPNKKSQQWEQLIGELQEALKKVTEEQPDDSERIVQMAKILASEVAKEKPNKSFLEISAKGLKEAANAVADIAPTVIEVAAKIASFIVGI